MYHGDLMDNAMTKNQKAKHYCLTFLQGVSKAHWKFEEACQTAHAVRVEDAT
jgi:hypothetical protein